jgi:hypothetical protein
MNPDNQPKPAARENGNAGNANGTGAKTPSTDMQPEDTGTPESGNPGAGDAAGSAMKQTSKTPTERGER